MISDRFQLLQSFKNKGLRSYVFVLAFDSDNPYPMTGSALDDSDSLWSSKFNWY